MLNLRQCPWGFGEDELVDAIVARQDQSSRARSSTCGHPPLREPTRLRRAALWAHEESPRRSDAAKRLRRCSGAYSRLRYHPTIQVSKRAVELEFWRDLAYGL